MSRRRVVVTGYGLTSPLGNGRSEVLASLRQGRSGIRVMDEWPEVAGMRTRLAGPVFGLERSMYKRKEVRTVGRVGLLSFYATDQALEDANLKGSKLLQAGRLGVAYGSTHGSSSELEGFCDLLFRNQSLLGIHSSAYLRFMSHTCVVNLAIRYGVRGRIISTCSACTSASQAIGFGYETIRDGAQDIMICGGAEELHFSHVAVFEVMFATSTQFNDSPDQSPRPFDIRRDGLVVGEGAGTLILEELEHARARGAPIYGEIHGFGTNCDGSHVTLPSKFGMAAAMRLALEEAELEPGAVGYINAHATGTAAGDVAESLAIGEVFGQRVPVSSTKGHTGHTLGACGSIETIFCLLMLREGFLVPNRNLEEVDPKCAQLNFLRGDLRNAQADIILNNNFAFGGINTSLVLGRGPAD